jgi:hypothetical protein
MLKKSKSGLACISALGIKSLAGAIFSHSVGNGDKKPIKISIFSSTRL